MNKFLEKTFCEIPQKSTANCGKLFLLKTIDIFLLLWYNKITARGF